jgi:3-hydroxyisobutyrate dehydrogenase-like beta-hydroxyacid dehydrogenase
MVERLLAAGAEVSLFARRAEVRERFAELGANIAQSVAEVAASADVVIVCPFSEAQLLEIVDGPEGLLAHAGSDTVIVQHATVSPTAIEQLAGRAGPVTILDAPISGRSDDILAGRLTVLVGGPQEALARVEPALRTYSTHVIATGSAGSATRVKLVNNLVYAAHVQVAGAAVSIANELGLSTPELLEALSVCSARSFAFTVLQGVGGDPVIFASASAPYLRKDVAVVEKALAELGAGTAELGAIVRGGPFQLIED